MLLISAGLSVVALICSLYISLSLKGKRTSEVAAIGNLRTEPEEKEKRLRVAISKAWI